MAISSSPAPLGPMQVCLRLGAIALILALLAGAFLYTGGWLAPRRLTPAKFVDALQANGGVHAGFRRNHAKGVCVTGTFDSNGAAAALSKAKVFEPGKVPVVGRFALPSPNPYTPDAAVPLRSMALLLATGDGQQWRTGMNSMPVFPVSTPQAFYEQQVAGEPDPRTGKPDPARLGAFFGAHPETAAFLSWAKTAKPSASYATETYGSINSFYLVDARGHRQAVRWQMVAAQKADADAAAPAGTPDFLEADLMKRLAQGPLDWHLVFTLAEPTDAVDNAAVQWPADRKTIDAGTLELTAAQPQANGACRDINYDPLVLPAGIEPSADPLLAARSAVYANSYQRRTGEEAAGRSEPEAVKAAGEPH